MAGLVVLDDGKRKTVTGVGVSFDPTHQVDAFGRLRVSNPTNLFEHTFKYNIDFDTYWDTETTNGGTVTHDSSKVSRFLNVTSTSGSSAVMQSRRRMLYYAGKSHLFQFSVNFRGASANINKKMGLFDDNNGFFFYTEGTTLGVCIRSDVSGSVVDTSVEQADWNGDKLDGTGTSGITADADNGQLFWIDYAWLGIGGVRFGIFAGGKFITLHTVAIANNQPDPYCKSPHLPYRLEIENMGGGTADEMSAVCCAYEVEGAETSIGKVRPWNSGTTDINVQNEEVLYIGRINPLYPYSSAILEKVRLMISSGGDELLLQVYHNPTITSGAITWNDVDGSIMQVANNPNSASINTSTGLLIDTDILRTDGDTDMDNSDIYFGFAIDETPDIIVITADSLNGNADTFLNVIIREFY